MRLRRRPPGRERRVCGSKWRAGRCRFEHAWSVRRPWRSKSPFFDAIFVLCGADLPGNHLSLARKVPVAALVEAFVCVLTELRKSGARSSNSNFRDPSSLVELTSLVEPLTRTNLSHTPYFFESFFFQALHIHQCALTLALYIGSLGLLGL